MSNYIAHYGILGQKWGVRRFQNEDRSLTPEGKERYAKRSKDIEKAKKYAKNELKKDQEQLKSWKKKADESNSIPATKESIKKHINISDDDYEDYLREYKTPENIKKDIVSNDLNEAKSFENRIKDWNRILKDLENLKIDVTKSDRKYKKQIDDIFSQSEDKLVRFIELRSLHNFMKKSGMKHYLIHYGIKGQKWGVRRFQNEDGTLTEEGKKRYLGTGKEAQAQLDVLNKAVDRSNKDLDRINKKYEDVDLTADDKANLEYTREVRDAFMNRYYEALAEDLRTDPATLKGQEWIEEMPFSHKIYTSDMDYEIADLENKLNQKEKNSKSSSIASENKKANNKADSYTDKYLDTKMTQSKAIQTAYADLEKIYPNFNDLPMDKQDELFFDYLNESGLYMWL